ncbi:MAG: hypothetical protein ACOCRA_01290 [Halobacteria archaeon]
MLNEVFVLLEVVVLSVALPFSVVAALGFRGSPFGGVTTPIPVVLASYIAADGSRLVFDHPSGYFYATFTTIAVVAAVYSAVNATLLLTERRAV